MAGSCNSQRDFSGVSALPVHEGLTPELLVPWRGSDTSFGCVPCQMKKTISPECFGHVKNLRSFTGYKTQPHCAESPASTCHGQEVRSHILILSDPNGSAHVGWAEMYDGRFIPALKTALEEDDDENGGIQQIVRCAMKTVVAACEAQIHCRFTDWEV